jgi:hypothetical protein
LGEDEGPFTKVSTSYCSQVAACTVLLGWLDFIDRW